MRPQLFRSRYDAAITFFGEDAQGQLQAARIELRIPCDALSFVQNNDGARSGRAGNSGGDLRGIALHRIEPANRPADQGEPAPIKFRMNKNIF